MAKIVNYHIDIIVSKLVKDDSDLALEPDQEFISQLGDVVNELSSDDVIVELVIKET